MEQVNTKGQQIALQIDRNALFFQEMRSRRAYRRPTGGRLSAQQSTIAMRSAKCSRWLPKNLKNAPLDHPIACIF